MPHSLPPPASGVTARPSRKIAGVERYGVEDAHRLYQRIWGSSFHFGRWEAGVTSIEDAVLCCKMRIGEALALDTHQHALEAGSGLGETARFLANAYDCHVTATNISEMHLHECIARTDKANMSASVTCAYADYHAMPFEDGYFDAYVMQEALVHATDKPRVMAEAFRVLKPGGRMVFTDQTTMVETLSKADCDRIIERHGSPDLFDAAAFERAAEQAGFHILANQDWSSHMARHFAELVLCLESDYAALARDIDPVVIDWNLDTWRFARDKACDGAMGWVFIAAEKPA